MFGTQYDRLDRRLAARDEVVTPLYYAERLLCDLLNRAATLQELVEGMYEGDGPTARQNAAVRQAVEIFLDDAEEARLRARRARLVSLMSDTGEVGPGLDGVETGKSLAEIGGALLPEDESEATVEASPPAEGGQPEESFVIQSEMAVPKTATAYGKEIRRVASALLAAHALLRESEIKLLTEGGLTHNGVPYLINLLNSFVQYDGGYVRFDGKQGWERREVAHA